MARGRRKNGEGCFSKNGNGYDYRISYIDNLGKSKYKYFWAKTKDECLAKANKWRNEQEGIYSDDVNASWTIEQWANFWFDNYVVNHVKITTVSDDRSILDHHIIPGIGKIRLKDLTGVKLQRFYNVCAEKSNGRKGKLDPKTIKNIYTVVNRMLKCAYNIDLIDKNPNEKATLPKRPKKQTKALTSEDHEKIIKSCISSKTTMDILVIFFLMTGLRLGEGLGLQWKNVDMDKKTIKIDRQLQAVPNDDKNSKHKFKKEILESTKTKHSNRILPVYDEVIQLLKHIKYKQAVNKMKSGSKYRRDLDLVFCNDDGRPICDTVLRKFLNNRLDELGIGHFRIHDLRHSYATRLFEDDIKTKLISEYLGHSSIGITLDTYTHVSPEKLKDVVAGSGNRFKKIFNNSEKEILDEFIPHK